RKRVRRAANGTERSHFRQNGSFGRTTTSIPGKARFLRVRTPVLHCGAGDLAREGVASKVSRFQEMAWVAIFYPLSLPGSRDWQKQLLETDLDPNSSAGSGDVSPKTAAPEIGFSGPPGVDPRQTQKSVFTQVCRSRASVGSRCSPVFATPKTKTGSKTSWG